MLQRLHIRNYAIIDDLTIDFQHGLNIITGETGAGKSILMGALGLVLGNRADTAVLFNHQEKCFVEATFQYDNSQKNIAELLIANDLDPDELLNFRREIAPTGKSRSFINDTPVTLQVLRLIAEQMVDLHRQFDALSLGENEFQRQVIDALAGALSLFKTYSQQFTSFKQAEKEWLALTAQQTNASKELDYYSFLLEELELAQPQSGELETLETEQQLLSQAGQIKSILASICFNLLEDEPSMVQQIKLHAQHLQSIRIQDASLKELAQRLSSAHIELLDIAKELERANDRIANNPIRLQEVDERLTLLYKLLKKHNVATTDALLTLQQSFRKKVEEASSLDDRLEHAKTQMTVRKEKACEIALQLSTLRKQILADFEQNTTILLTQMGMPGARLIVKLVAQSDKSAVFELHPFGIDTIQFLFDANKSGRPEPLEKVASGGELSRLMLAIKSQVAQSVQLPALIFDEIDAGISGEAARQVGLLMKKLSEAHQVLAITHQPQIAAKASAHYFVHKKEKDGHIKTQVRLLTDIERVESIARMLSGEVLSDTSLQIAREMIEGK